LKIWTGNGHASTEAISHTLGYSFQVQHLASFATPTIKDDDPAGSDNLAYYLGVYIAFSVACAILGTFRYYYIFTGSIRASRRMFEKLSFVILRTPLRWIDTVPLGRILNRFTADFNIVDARLSGDISYGANNVFRLIGIVIAG
jgi:ABC-type multidrug transport system fused ATPase/permease subunit